MYSINSGKARWPSGKSILYVLFTIFLFVVMPGNYLLAGGSLQDSSLVVPDTLNNTYSDTLPVENDTAGAFRDTIDMDKHEQVVENASGGHKYAKISRVDGVELTVLVLNTNLFEVRYVYPLNTEEHVLSKADIKEIAWPGGKKEKFGKKIQVDSSRVLVLNEKDWELVTITENKEEILDLKEKGEIEATFESGKLKIEAEFLEKNASIILRKKAARINAHKILIKSKEIKAGYGELPTIEMRAIAYGYE